MLQKDKDSILDFPGKLRDMLRELHILSGFRISLYDTKRNELCAFPQELTSFCALIQQNKKALSLCHSFDQKAFEKVQSTGATYIYRCHCGLYEAVAPLYHFGVLTGYLMMGQTIDTQKTSRDFVFQKALPFVLTSAENPNNQELLQTIAEIPSRSREQIQSCISIMEICASYITLSNYLKNPDKNLPARVRSYLLQNYSSPIHLDMLCNEFYCSRATLTSSFRAAYSQSVMDYLNQIRMHKAHELLTERTDLSVREVAQACGFPDQNYFAKVFRRYYQKTPRQARKDDRKEIQQNNSAEDAKTLIPTFFENNTEKESSLPETSA